MALEQIAVIGIALSVIALLILLALMVWFSLTGIQKDIRKERRIRDKMMGKYGMDILGDHYHPVLTI